MKKNLLSVGAVALMAFAISFSSCGTKGCLTTTDDNYNSEATIDDPAACDATATDNKFVGTWTAPAVGNYTFVISDNSADYRVTAVTNLGLTDNNQQPLPAVTVNLDVNGKIATAATFSIGNATISNLKFTYISTSQGTLAGEISGTGVSGVDGVFSDTMEK